MQLKSQIVNSMHLLASVPDVCADLYYVYIICI
jgi:hypothetical protein